jgi:hypothetical protein
MCAINNLGFGLLAAVASMMAAPVSAQPQKPNIVMLMADDISFDRKAEG